MLERVYGVLLVLWGRLPIPGWLRWVILWLFNSKFLVGVAAIILNERRELLLCHHTYRDYPWDIPGGWLKMKEDPGKAIEREIGEETGLIVRAERPVRSTREKGTPALHIIFSARLVGGEFRPSPEVDEIRFFPLASLPELIPGEAEVLREVVAVTFPDG